MLTNDCHCHMHIINTRVHIAAAVIVRRLKHLVWPMGQQLLHSWLVSHYDESILGSCQGDV